MKILVVEGTARKGRKSIHAARHVTELLNERADAELFDLADREIPMLEHTRYSDNDNHPEDIEEFGKKVESADGLVLVAPEYNHSMPGSLKNLLDHLYPEYEDKSFSYVTVSAGGFGGVRALSHLHDVTLEFNGIPGPDLPVSNIGSVFDGEGSITDKEYEEKFEKFADKVVEHVEENS